MQQHKIFTRTLLILSIINFALAAPVAVRQGSEVASQKWSGSDDEGELPLPSTPWLDYASAPSPELSNIMSEMGYAHNLPTPDSPGFGYEVPDLDHASSPEILSQIASTDMSPTPGPDTGSLPGSDYMLPSMPSHVQPPSPGTEVGLSQIPKSEPPTPDSPVLPGSDHVLPGPSLDYLPPPSPGLASLLSLISYSEPPTPDSPSPGLDYVLPPVAGSLSSPPRSHPSQPGPSEDHLQLFPVNQPKLPQSWVEPMTLKSYAPTVWEMIKKGRIIERHISGSDAVKLD